MERAARRQARHSFSNASVLAVHIILQKNNLLTNQLADKRLFSTNVEKH